MQNTLDLTADLPLVHYAPGAEVVREGAAAGGLWVLVSGALEIRKGTVTVATVTKPGALIGEISVLLKSAYSATVVATEPTTMRYATDGAAVLASQPAIILRMAEGLAERLSFVTTYLADLKYQYGDAPGLAMVSDVLRELSERRVPPARAGSARDPDPDY
jgi:CRP-like cAMP-binding protein